MKTDVMQTHLKEETPVFLCVNKISKLFVVFLFLSSTLHSQINLNGFGEVTLLAPSSGAVHVVSTIIDSDSEPDYIITTTAKSLVLYTSGRKYQPQVVKMPYVVSSIQRIKRVSKTESEFAFTSRVEKVFGTFTLNDRGKAYSFKTIKFDYYPENFVLSKNGKKAIIFGNNFNGLVFIDLDLNKKKMLTFLENRIIKDAIFLDFDNDLNTDIVYYDIFSESINLIRNEINFQLTEINLSKKVNNLTRFRKADFNYDGFEDLLFSSERGIEIFKGDSVNTFEKSEVLISAAGIIDFQLCDFNRDGYFDFVYCKKDDDKKNRLYVSFLSSNNMSNPFLISSFTPIISFDVAGWRKDRLIYLTEDGNIKLVTSIGELENTTLQLGINPRNIFSFKKQNDLLQNLAVVDSSDSKLKLYANALGDYYEFALKKIHNNLEVESIGDSEILFVMFTKNEKLIEINKLNLKDGKTLARQYYAANPIVDVKIEPRDKTLPAIMVLTQNNGIASIEEFEYRDFRYQKSEPKTVVDSALSAQLSSRKSVVYLRKNFRNEIVSGEKYLKEFDAAKSYSNFLVKTDLVICFSGIREFEFSGRSFEIASFVIGQEKKSYLLYDNKRIQLNRYLPVDDLSVITVSINSVLEVIYRSEDKILFSELNKKTGKVHNTKIISDYAGDFVVEYVNRKNGYIFMINKKNNLIELKKIQ